MQLSTDTWHYRNFQVWQKRTRTLRHADLVPQKHRRASSLYYGRERRPDLCTYTRIVLLWAPLHRAADWLNRHDWVFPASIMIFLYGVFVAMGYGIAEQEGYAGWWFPWIVLPGVLIGGVAGLLSLIAGYFMLLDKLKDHNRRVTTQPSVVGEYIKARKSKVCPILEFEEE